MSQNDVWKKNRRDIISSIGNQSRSWLDGQNVQPLQTTKVADRPRRIGSKPAGLKDY